MTGNVNRLTLETGIASFISTFTQSLAERVTETDDVAERSLRSDELEIWLPKIDWALAEPSLWEHTRASLIATRAVAIKAAQERHSPAMQDFAARVDSDPSCAQR